MKDRLVTLAGALFALYVLMVLMIPPASLEQTKISLPTSIDDGEYGYLGLKRWLEQSRVPVKALRRRYHSLGDIANQSLSGNLLIITLPQKLPARDKEINVLKQWIKAGNSVLILNAQTHSPAWSNSLKPYSADSFLGKLGFYLSWEVPASTKEVEEDAESVDEDENADDAPIKPADILLTPASSHPAVYGVRKIYASAVDVEREKKELEVNEDHRSTLVLLKNAQSGNPYLWLGRLGKGRVWLSQHGDLFGNISLGKKDNARLLDNIINLSLSAKGMVIFDDMHHGNSELYDPDAFFSDSRLHNSIWFIFAFWLLYVVGYNNRLAPLQNKVTTHRNIDFVKAIGGFIARHIDKKQSTDLMFAHFFNSVRQHHRMPANGLPVWDLIKRSSGISQNEHDQLKQLYNNRFSSSRQDLVKLHNLLLGIRSALI